jgi:hypothetical protein
MGYSLSGSIHLFFKYLGSDQPAKLGLGWDRWFVFLAKGGLSRTTLAAIGVLMLAGLIASLTGLIRSLKSAPA